MNQFLPVTKADLAERGWEEFDFLVITGDAYVDHPSFGPAIISRVLEAEGYLRSEKAFVGRRPNTTYTLLPYGREQFAQYVALLESLLAGAQGEEGADSPS